MDIHQLRVFQAAARSGGFTRAGETLFLSQSTVSQHIKLLEEELGCPLFLRVGRQVAVTEAGALLLQYTDRVFRELKNAEMAVRDLSAMRRGTVRLGTGASTLVYRLPRVLAAYTRSYPNLELIVLTGTTEFLLDAIKGQSLDLAIVMAPVSRAGIAFRPLGTEELVVTLSRRHPLARKTALDRRDLASLRFILYQKKTAMQNLLDAFFTQLGVTPQVAMELENIEAIKSLVRAGLGASILPVCAVRGREDASELRAVRVKGAPLERILGVAMLESDLQPRAIQELVGLLESEFARSARASSSIASLNDSK
jgi:DNA-binding transcriptional LysR family regulator